MRRSFGGAVVLITGGAGGLGRAFAERFARAGARIALLDVDEPALAAAVAPLELAGVPVMGLVCDVTNPADVAAAVERVAAAWGDADVVINNAGMTHRSAFRDTQLSVYRRVMDVSYFGALHVTKAALEGLIRRRGLIVTISSIAGIAPLYGRTGYAGAKHALHGTFESLRTELAADGVGVLMVAPSFVDTQFQFRALDADGTVTDHPQSRVGGVLTPARAADRVFKAAERNRKLLVLSPTGKAARWVHALAPGIFERLMQRSLRSELDRPGPTGH